MMDELMLWALLGLVVAGVLAWRWRRARDQAGPDVTPERPGAAASIEPPTVEPGEPVEVPTAEAEAGAAEAERQAQEEAERQAAAQREAEERARLEAERLAAEAAAAAAAAAEAERQAQEEAERQVAAQREAEEQARLEAERLAAEAAAAAAAAAEAERQAQQEAERQAAAQREAEEQARLEAERLAAAPALRPLRADETVVFVVDDSKVVRVKTQRALAPQGYQVVLAENGEEAVAKMAVQTPHVVITDVEMPGMDGFELTRYVRASTALGQIPVIMITSADDRREAAEAAGVTTLLGKPYAEADLIACIERAREAVQVPA